MDFKNISPQLSAPSGCHGHDLPECEECLLGMDEAMLEWCDYMEGDSLDGSFDYEEMDKRLTKWGE